MIPIKCPHCKVGLKVDEKKIPQGISSFKCPKCKHEIALSSIRELQDERRENVETVVIPVINKSEGRLTVLFNEDDTPEQIFPLKEEGLYIVGRKASVSNANICIDTQDKLMSRHHLRMDVKKDIHGNLIYTVSDYGSKNHTEYNGRVLEDGEVVVLKDLDEIVIGRTVLRFNC